MSRKLSVAYNQGGTMPAHYGYLAEYLCFSAQDFILIICHAIIVGDTRAECPPAHYRHRAPGSDQTHQVAVNVQPAVIVLEISNNNKMIAVIKCS
ncbi:hypothetical protein [Brucella anthropi]|uniref:hypothetical protein n=1 Tax=Brucella anthropi TaxID=529 RepID=UPI00235E5629|nr:hypothetical protein [Brucella anthropi]